MLRAIALAVMLSFTFVGCAAVDTATNAVEKNEKSAELVIKYATMKYIDEDPAKANAVARIARDLQNTAESGAVVTVMELEEQVRGQVDFSQLDPADTMLADQLIDRVAAELKQRVGTGGIEGDQVLTVMKVLGWVDDAAIMSGASMPGGLTS